MDASQRRSQKNRSLLDCRNDAMACHCPHNRTKSHTRYNPFPWSIITYPDNVLHTSIFFWSPKRWWRRWCFWFFPRWPFSDSLCQAKILCLSRSVELGPQNSNWKRLSLELECITRRCGVLPSMICFWSKDNVKGRFKSTNWNVSNLVLKNDYT